LQGWRDKGGVQRARCRSWSIALAGLPTLQEILAVQSTRVEAHLFRRGADRAWPSDPEVFGEGDAVRLSTIDLDLPVAEIYRQTALAG
jgi:hypothetical protein